MVTAGTYLKQPLFYGRERLSTLTDALLRICRQYQMSLQAWAVFPNHYHFIATLSADAKRLSHAIRHLHSDTGRMMNLRDSAPGRRVWFQFWDTHLTFSRSFYARLNYVHQNAVRHGLVREASLYPWCSAGWFKLRSTPAFHKTVTSFPVDCLRIPDDYEVSPEHLKP